MKLFYDPVSRDVFAAVTDAEFLSRQPSLNTAPWIAVDECDENQLLIQTMLRTNLSAKDDNQQTRFYIDEDVDLVERDGWVEDTDPENP